MIVPIHTHSMYSALDGFATPEEIATRVEQLGCPCCGLTDHGVVSGHLHFAKALGAKGIKPLFGCLFAGQTIITDSGIKNVEDICEGDLVLTHKGRFKRVGRTMKRWYEGTVYEIHLAQTRRNPLRLTEEHPILIKATDGHVAWRTPDQIPNATKWQGSGNLQGAAVCFPKLNEASTSLDVLSQLPHQFVDCNGTVGRPKMGKYDRAIIWSLPCHLTLDEGLARLLGFFASEGSVAKKMSGQITFSFGLHEPEYADFIVQELAHLGVTGTIRTRRERSICEVTACCVPLAYLLSNLCGLGAHNKKVPAEIMMAPRKVKQAFLSGLVDGDGKSLGGTNLNGSRTLKVASKALAWGFRTLLADLGFWSRVGEGTQDGHHYYTVPWNPDRKYSRTRDDDNYIYRTIREVVPSYAEDWVYNFEVEEDNSYVSDFILHNCELYHGLKTTFKPGERDQAHLIALAMTNQGLANLWNLVNCTAEANHFHNVGRVFWDDLRKYSEGLVVTSACALGLVPKALLNGDRTPLHRYLEIFGNNFYIEIHTYPWDVPFNDRDAEGEVNMRVINEALVSIAWERGIPLVYANDAHYAFPEQAEYHDLYIASQTKQSIYTPIDERKMWHPPQALSLMSEPEVRKALDYLPSSAVDEAINNSVLLGERASAALPEVKRHLPVFVPADCPWLNAEQQSLSPDELFVDLVEAGIIERFGEDASQEVWDRALYEMETLIRDGIHHYFLMGWDEMMAAIAKRIETGPGRGSSAGCLVAYALAITDVDPLHYGLIFERFWNSGRAKGFPDIDSDFSRAQRDEVIAYLRERWGEDRVCSIGTTGYMKPKAVIDKLRGGCGISYEEAEQLKKIVGLTTKIDILGHEQIGWNPELEPGKKYYVKACVGKEIEEWVKAQGDYRLLERERFVKMCEICCSRVEQYGIHASGIVISDMPYGSELPAYRRGGKDKGKPATMFTMSDVDERMFIKLDVLGLRTLDVLEYWRQMMLEQDIDVKWSGMDKEEHPEEMWDMLKDGFTAGIFQVEDGYGRQLCKGMAPRSVEELSVLNALNRPGPIQAKIPDRYIARHRGEEPVTYIHPRFEEIAGEILAPTYGLFVFQEQIIAFFNALGYTLSESDGIRKIMGKKKPEQMNAVRDGGEEWEGRGYLSMAQAAGLPLEIAQQIWDDLEGFADYCFNKSHTVAYAVIGFRTLFAKYYGPGQFFAACLRSLDHSRDGDKRKDMAPQFVNECRRLNIEVAPPSIIHSKAHARVDDLGKLRFGFYDVKGVGNSGPYIEQLVRTMTDEDIATPENFHARFDQVNTAFLKTKKEKLKSGEWTNAEVGKSPKQMLQANKINCLARVGAWGYDHTLTEQQAVEQELLGVILTDNSKEVLDRNAEEIAQCDSLEEVAMPFGDRCRAAEALEIEYLDNEVCGIVTSIQEKRSKRSGQPFGIITIELGKHAVEFICFSNRWKTHKRLLKLRTVGIFKLRHAAPNEYGESYHFLNGRKLT